MGEEQYSYSNLEALDIGAKGTTQFIPTLFGSACVGFFWHHVERASVEGVAWFLHSSGGSSS